MNEIKTKKVLTEEQKAKQKAYYESRKEILKKKRENLTDEEKRIKREKRKEYKKNKSEMFKNYSREYYEKNKDIQKEKHTEYDRHHHNKFCLQRIGRSRIEFCLHNHTNAHDDR